MRTDKPRLVTRRAGVNDELIHFPNMFGTSYRFADLRSPTVNCLFHGTYSTGNPLYDWGNARLGAISHMSPPPWIRGMGTYNWLQVLWHCGGMQSAGCIELNLHQRPLQSIYELVQVDFRQENAFTTPLLTSSSLCRNKVSNTQVERHSRPTHQLHFVLATKIGVGYSSPPWPS